MHYLAWPASDRRQTDKRDHDRREFDRRQQQTIEHTYAQSKHPKLVLTREEKMLIEDLFLCDFE